MNHSDKQKTKENWRKALILEENLGQLLNGKSNGRKTS